MSAVEAPLDVAGVGDVGELYCLFSRRLEQIVRLDVRAPEVVVENACQFAWSRLVHHAHRVRREAVLSWLATTAVREALKLTRREQRELSLDAAAEWLDERALDSRRLSPHDLVEHRERLATLDALSERQRRMVWLHALGLSYGEIAFHTGCTLRTVERQLLRAKRKLRTAGNGSRAG